MLLGAIADDFTGASDLANTLARGGMVTRQFVGVPVGDGDCEAGVVALKTRSVPAADAVAASLRALAWLRAEGCSQVIFKYCSTFDSTPQGNIGPVGEALRSALGADAVIFCPAFPTAGRTVFQGHLFVGDRLLSESGMERHPLNPMTDPDLRRVLARQATLPVGHAPLATVRAGAETLRTRLVAEAAAGRPLVVVDAVTDDDLVIIGGAAADAPLITGGSGIAIGLPANFRARGLLGAGEQRFAPVQGPGAALAGSCSAATLRQIETYARTRPSLRLDPLAIVDGRTTVEDALAFARKHAADEPLIYSSAAPDIVAAAQAARGTDKVAAALETFFAGLAQHLVSGGVTRLVVAGGETSGAVVGALSVAAFDIGPEIAPGVPALSVPGGRPLALALKSGNFGDAGFFAKAFAALGAA